MSAGYKDFCSCFYYRLICKNVCLQKISSNCIVCICSTDPRATCCTMKCHVVMWEQRLSFLFFFIPVCHFLSQILTFLSTFFSLLYSFGILHTRHKQGHFCKACFVFLLSYPFLQKRAKKTLVMKNKISLVYLEFKV